MTNAKPIPELTDELRDRFWTHVDVREPDDCWEWTGTIQSTGYGSYSIAPQIWPAHRISYVINVGVLDETMVIDHLCRNRKCVNPAHLEVVTHRENILRGVGPSSQNASKTVCKNGHEFTAENTYTYPTEWGTGRGCKICRRDAVNRYARRKRVA